MKHTWTIILALAAVILSSVSTANRVAAQIQRVECGDAISGVFTENGQRHEYQIAVSAGMRLLILAEPNPGNYQDLRLDFGIYAPSGFEIDGLESAYSVSGHGEDQRPKHNTAALSEDGTYTILVFGVTSTGSPYTLYVGCMMPDNQVVTADYSSANLACGDILDNQVRHSEEYHDYYIELHQNDQVVITAVSTSTQFQQLRMDIGLYSPTDYEIDHLDSSYSVSGHGNNNSSEIATSPLSETGLYHLILRALSDVSGGSYTITVGCTLADGTVIRPGDDYGSQTIVAVGSFQSEIGCQRSQGIGGDWAPECSRSQLVDDNGDGIYLWSTTDIPAGNWEAKAVLDGTWDENYGQDGAFNGANIAFVVAEDGMPMTFEYDSSTHVLTISPGAAGNETQATAPALVITAPGSYQSEIGCTAGQVGGDWDPSCDLSLLSDPNGDDIYTWSSRNIPIGSWEMKIAIDRSWDENYGANGERDGANIPFSVTSIGQRVTFSYDSLTHDISIEVAQ